MSGIAHSVGHRIFHAGLHQATHEVEHVFDAVCGVVGAIAGFFAGGAAATGVTTVAVAINPVAGMAVGAHALPVMVMGGTGGGALVGVHFGKTVRKALTS